MNDADLEGIISVSVRNNTRDDLSGILVFHEQRILQVLEGPLDKLDACYARISADPRHMRIRLLANAPAKERMFGKWQMALAHADTLTPDCRQAALSLLDVPDVLPQGPQGEEKAARLLRSFLIGVGVGSSAGRKLA
jgi:hypothetical protein